MTRVRTGRQRVEHQRWQVRTYYRAMRKLVDRHRGEFCQLLDAERQAEPIGGQDVG